MHLRSRHDRQARAVLCTVHSEAAALRSRTAERVACPSEATFARSCGGADMRHLPEPKSGYKSENPWPKRVGNASTRCCLRSLRSDACVIAGGCGHLFFFTF